MILFSWYDPKALFHGANRKETEEGKSSTFTLFSSHSTCSLPTVLLLYVLDVEAPFWCSAIVPLPELTLGGSSVVRSVCGAIRFVRERQQDSVAHSTLETPDHVTPYFFLKKPYLLTRFSRPEWYGLAYFLAKPKAEKSSLEAAFTAAPAAALTAAACTRCAAPPPGAPRLLFFCFFRGGAGRGGHAEVPRRRGFSRVCIFKG